MKHKKKQKIASSKANIENSCFNELEDQIAEDGAYFQRLINLIPAKLYFDQDTWKEIDADNRDDDGVIHHGQPANKKKKNGHKQPSRKQKKFDPDYHKTVTQIQEEREEEDEDDSEPHIWKASSSSHVKENLSREELREKLRLKIEDLKGTRNTSVDSKRVMHRLKRRISKLDLKERRKKEKEAAASTHSSISSAHTSPSKAKPVFNQNGKMVFSKFDFSGAGGSGGKSKQPAGKDYKKLLALAEKRKEKVNKLKEVDPELAETNAQTSHWKSVMLKAEGVKTKDNIDLLRKAAKRKEKRKEKSQRKWNERKEQTQGKMDERQKKRQENIRDRKQAKFKSKINKLKKKGRMVPGF